MKIFSVDGEIVEPLKSNEIYVALFKKDGVWMVSGVFYRDINKIESNIYHFNPEKIVCVKVCIPDET